MKPGLHAVVLALLLAGCASLASREPEIALEPGEVRSAPAARDAVALGQSTKADVRAALGEATVIDFASGYEVWVYKEPRLKGTADKPAPPARELVLLFAPSGIATKARVR